MVGTPEKVADDIEAWFEQTDVDGLNVAFATSPGDFEDIADMLVPELTRRGRYKQAYAKGTLREKLFGAGRARLNASTSGEPVSRRRYARRRRSRGRVQRRHCERSEAIQLSLRHDGLLRRYAPRNDGLMHRAQFTELLTTTSINFAPGRLNADFITDFNSLGSVILTSPPARAISRCR